MDAQVSAHPHLDHFLNAYMHQDWGLFGDDLKDIVRLYADETSASDVRELRLEIENFIVLRGPRIEIDYPGLFPNSALPAGWCMRAAEWLRYISGLAHMFSAPPTDSAGSAT